jgi:hypothetical protein
MTLPLPTQFHRYHWHRSPDGTIHVTKRWGSIPGAHHVFPDQAQFDRWIGREHLTPIQLIHQTQRDGRPCQCRMLPADGRVYR